jgi:hypothetical protein
MLKGDYTDAWKSLNLHLCRNFALDPTLTIVAQIAKGEE